MQYMSYKTCVKDRLREIRKNRSVMTQAYIAEKLGVQSPYLSRVLNTEKAQFSEDQLYRLLEALGFNEDEREFLFLLRTYEVTGLPERRAEIERRIRKIQAAESVKELTCLTQALSEAMKEAGQS